MNKQKTQIATRAMIREMKVGESFETILDYERRARNYASEIGYYTGRSYSVHRNREKGTATVIRNA